MKIKHEGFIGKHPSIKKLSFRKKGKMEVILEDGREILVPLKYFPSIQKLTGKQRRYYTILEDEGIMFKHSDFIYHIQDILGKEKDYAYNGFFNKKNTKM